MSASQGPVPAAGGVPTPVLFTGLLKSSWSLYRANFVSLFILFLPLGAASFVALIPLLVLHGRDVQLHTGLSLGASLSLELLTVLPMVAGGLGMATGAALMTDRLTGRHESVTNAFRKVLPLLGALLTAALVSSLLALVLRLVVPPFAFFVQPLLYGPIIVVQVIALEGADLKAGLARAGELSKGDRVRTFMYLFPFSLAVTLLVLVLPALAGWGLSFIPNDAVILSGATLAEIVVTAAVVPFIAAAQLVSYFDLRARKENLDLASLREERHPSG